MVDEGCRLLAEFVVIAGEGSIFKLCDAEVEGDVVVDREDEDEDEDEDVLEVELIEELDISFRSFGAAA